MDCCKQIIITEITDGYQWIVIRGQEVIGFGFEDDSSQAFKIARATFDTV